MPQTNEGVLLFIGAVFFLIGLLGGGFEVSAIKIPPIGKFPRFLASGMGVMFMGLAITRLIFPSFPPPPSAISVVTETPTSTLLTDTPEPTNTPKPPTATIDADPTVYDNFNNPANDGSFNKYQWIMLNDSMGKVIQKDGRLIVSYDNKTPENGISLSALKYDSVIQTPTFFEAKLMVDKPPQNGWVFLLVGTGLPTGDYSVDRHWRSPFCWILPIKRPPPTKKVKDGRLPFTQSQAIVLQ